MAARGQSRAEANRAIRRESMIEVLRGKGLVQKVIEDIELVRDLSEEIDAQQLKRIEFATNNRLALLRKILPDLKATEITGEGGGPLLVQTVSYADNSASS